MINLKLWDGTYLERVKENDSYLVKIYTWKSERMITDQFEQEMKKREGDGQFG